MTENDRKNAETPLRDAEERTISEETEQIAGREAENAEQGREQENDRTTDDGMKKKYAELYDNYIRLLAEYDNFKKRTAKEKEEIYARAVTDVVMKLLPVIDNFDRAEQFVGEDGVKEGFMMIRKQFNECLTKLAIAEIEAQDKPFDPNLHEAVFHEQVEGGPENTVAEVLQKGYLLHDRVLRHAVVKVIN